MIPFDGRLLVGLVAGLALAQALAGLAARGLGLRLPRRAMACGVAAPLLLLGPWLRGQRLLVPCDILMEVVPGAPRIGHPDPHSLLNDAVYQFLPWELEIRHALAARRLPFWSDRLEGGSSPWANPQASVLSPAAMAGRLLPIQHHLLGALAAKILLALEGTYLLARLLGASRRASLLAGAGFALGGGVIAWGLFPHSSTVAWVPWLAAGTIRLVRRPRAPAAPRTIAATAAVTAALLLSGHPETAAIGGLFAAFCGLAYRRRRGRLVPGLAAAGAAALLGFGLAAPLLLPFLDLLPRSARAEETLALHLPLPALRLADPWSWFYLGRGAFTLTPLNPLAWGRPFHVPFHGPLDWVDAASGYTGLVALAGGALALAGPRLPRRRAAPLLAFAGVALLLAAKLVPLAWPLYAVRPLRALTYERFLPVGSLALAVAGGLGLDAVLRRRERRAAAVWVALAAAAGSSLAVAPRPSVAGLWALLAAAVALAAPPPSQPLSRSWPSARRRAPAALLAAALLLDLVPWSRDLLPAGRPGLFYPRTPFVEEVAHLAGPAEGPGGHRAVGALFLLYPSLLPFYGIADPRPHDPLVPAAYLSVLGDAFGFRPTMTQYFAPFDHVDHPLLRFLGVRAVVGSVALPASHHLVLRSGQRYAPFFLYENPGALPRWFVPGSAVVVGRSGIGGFLATLDDPARVALFADEVRGFQPAGLTGSARPLPVLAASPGRTVLALPPGADLVATSIPATAGWRARADGRHAEILTVDGSFLGVRVPAGATRLTLVYRPPGLVPGTAAALVSALAAAALLAAAGRRRRRGSP
jgi:hypothetical protein